MNQLNLLGIDVFVDPSLDNVPKMTVSPRFAELMPPEFVADLNAWMREFFGVENRTYFVNQFNKRALIVGPATLKALESA